MNNCLAWLTQVLEVPPEAIRFWTAGLEVGVLDQDAQGIPGTVVLAQHVVPRDYTGLLFHWSTYYRPTISVGPPPPPGDLLALNDDNFFSVWLGKNTARGLNNIRDQRSPMSSITFPQENCFFLTDLDDTRVSIEMRATLGPPWPNDWSEFAVAGRLCGYDFPSVYRDRATDRVSS